MLHKVFKTSTLALICTTALSGAVAVTAQAAEAQTERHKVEVTTVAEGLNFPWGLAFLPNGDALVTEKSGDVRRVGMDGSISDAFTGIPDVVYKSQGGLLDIALDPDFADNSFVYLSYSEADPDGGDGNSTAVARGKLQGNGLTNVEVIFRGAPKYESGAHFGSRLVFSPEGHLFVTLGDRYSAMDAPRPSIIITVK